MNAPTPPPPANSGAPQPSAPGPAALASERPEVLAAGAFAGGFLLAMILRRLG